MECQPQDSEGGRVSDLAVRRNGYEGGMVIASGPYDEFTDSILVIHTGWILQIKALVIMVMPVQDHVCMGCVQKIPERLAVGGCPSARAEQRNMPEGQGALVKVRRQVSLQPAILRRSRAAAAHVAAVRIQGDQMPGTDIETVPALTSGARCRTEVLEIAGGIGVGGIAACPAAGQIFMITN